MRALKCAGIEGECLAALRPGAPGRERGAPRKLGHLAGQFSHAMRDDGGFMSRSVTASDLYTAREDEKGGSAYLANIEEQRARLEPKRGRAREAPGGCKLRRIELREHLGAALFDDTHPD